LLENPGDLMNYCEWCNPEKYYIYGICENCLRECNPPLMDIVPMNTYKRYLSLIKNIKDTMEKKDVHSR
jgi:hypothetical protein